MMFEMGRTASIEASMGAIHTLKRELDELQEWRVKQRVELL